MNKFLLCSISSFCLLLAVSCKKPLPADIEDTSSPVFYAKCEVNGLPLKLEAGSNDYYMNSSFYVDSVTKVYVFKSDLSQSNCKSNCNFALSILINNSQLLPAGAPMDVNTGIRPGVYRFNSHQLPPISYRATFTPLTPNMNEEHYAWSFEAGAPIDAYEVTQDLNPGTYSVKLDYRNAHGTCNASHVNVFDVANPLQTSVSSVNTDGLSYRFSTEPTGGTGPYQYVWDFDDNTTVSNSPNPTHTYTQQGWYRVKLLLTDSKGNTCTSYYQLLVSDGSGCAANFKASFVPLPDTTALSAVTILFTDASGKVSSSKDFVQPSGSSFEIVSVEDYKQNDQGLPTKKVKIRFNCTVNNGSDQLVIRNGEAVIAVAYKN